MEENPTTSSNQDEIACSNCGAKLTFAPGTDSLKCEFCGTVNEIEIDEELKQEVHQEIDFHKFLNEQSNIAPKMEVLVLQCNRCGAQTTFDPNVISGSCDFCGSPLTSKEHTKMKST